MKSRLEIIKALEQEIAERKSKSHFRKEETIVRAKEEANNEISRLSKELEKKREQLVADAIADANTQKSAAEHERFATMELIERQYNKRYEAVKKEVIARVFNHGNS